MTITQRMAASATAESARRNISRSVSSLPVNQVRSTATATPSKRTGRSGIPVRVRSATWRWCAVTERVDEADGKRLHLFESTRGGWVRYVMEAIYLGVHDAVAPDRNRTPRRALVFELALGDRDPAAVVPDLRTQAEPPSADLRGRTLAELRAGALAGAAANSHRRGSAGHCSPP